MSAPTMADYAIVYIGLAATLGILGTLLVLAISDLLKAIKRAKGKINDN